MGNPWRDRDKLYEIYKERGLTQKEVADEWGCSCTTVRKWIEKHGIQKHDHDELVSEALTNHNEGDHLWHDEKTLSEMYVEREMSTIDIADELGCSPSTIRRRLDEYNIPIRDRSEAVHLGRDGGTNGVNHYYDQRGYEVIKGEQIPTKIYVHRWTAYAHNDVSFDEMFKSVTHHENTHKHDNRPSNLSLMTNSEHARLHA